MHRMITFLLLTMAISSVTTAGAPNDEADKAVAEEKFRTGLTHAKAGRYEQAQVYFEESIALYPSQSAMFNLANTLKMRNQFVEALEIFKKLKTQYAGRINKEIKAATDNHIDELEKMVSTLQIQADQGVTEIHIDGEKVSLSNENTVLLNPGVYDLDVTLDGYAPHHRKVTLKGGMVRIESFSMTPLEETKTVLKDESQRKTIETMKSERTLTSPRKYIGIGMTGLGGAVMVAGAVTGGLALKNSNQLSDNCPDKNACSISERDLETRARLLATTTNVLLPIGGILLTTGVVFLIIGIKKSESNKSVSFRVKSNLNNVAVFVFSGRF